MNALRARLHHVFSAAIVLGVLGLGAPDAQATHFRYGTLRWELTTPQPTDPNLVRIKVTGESAWRRSFSWPGGGTPNEGSTINTGQSIVVQNIGTFANIASAPLSVFVTAVNVTEDWFVGSTTAEFEFAKSNLPVRIFWQGNARVSNLQDTNNDRPFRVEAIMTATPNMASPAASILPIITVPYPAPGARFFIPATDVENDTLTWSISDLPRSQLNKMAPDGVLNTFVYTLWINPATGEVTWRTDQELAPPANGHYYAVQFLVTDSKGAQTPVDALLRLIPAVGTAPEMLIAGSPDAYAVDVRPNNTVTFVITGTDADADATVTLTSGALPPGAVMTPSLPTAGPAPRSSTFTWTPTVAQAGNTFPISFAVTDNFGMQDTNSASVRVLSNFPPVAGCPADLTLEATSGAGASTTLAATVSDADGDGLTVRWSVDGTLVETDTVPAGPGTTTVTLTRNFGFLPSPHVVLVEVSDALATVSCTSEVIVVDTTDPILSLPPSQVLEATGPSGAAAVWSPDPPTAEDTVDGTIDAVCTHASGATFPLGTTTVSCTATDSHGNSATGTFTIEVVDTTDPVLTLPASQVLEATGPGGATATFSASATDIVDPAPAVACAPASGTTFAINGPSPAATVVTCTATDFSGNSASGTFTVRVQDTTPPVISGMPANMTVTADMPGGAVVSWTSPTAHDIVDLSVPVTCAPASGTIFFIGTTTVTCTASDTRFNTSSASFTVTVVAAAPPVFTVSLNPGLLWPPNHKMVNIAVTVTPPSTTCNIHSVTSNQPQNGTGDGDTDIDWIFSGMTLQLRAERAGNLNRGVGRIYTVTVACVGPSGATGFASATANVPHDMGGRR